MKSLQGINGVSFMVTIPGTSAAYEGSSTLVTDLVSGSTFILPNAQIYVLGSNALQVWVDGIAQNPSLDWSETSTTAITFSKTIKAGSTIRIRG